MTRRFGRGVTSLALVLLVTAGCGVHLHRPNDAKQARAALDGFNRLELDTAMQTMRTNIATLTADEIETRQKMGEVLVRRDALSVVAFKPVGPSDQALPRGWPKLLAETDDVMRKYAVFTGTPAQLDVQRLRLITGRTDNIENLALERRVFESLVRTFTSTGRPAPTCSAPPSDEIRLACGRVGRAEQTVADGEALLSLDAGYAALVRDSKIFEDELKQTDAAEKVLAEQYAAAKSKLTEAQSKLAKDPAKTESAAEAKRIADLKQDVAAATDALASAVDASKQFPVVASALKNDLVQEIIGNAKFLSGDAKSPAHEVTKQLVAALNRYPDVAGRLKAATAPSVNVLLLEAALQRLEYKSLVEERTAKRDVVAILRAKRNAMIEATTQWARVVENLHRPEFPPALHERLKSATVAEVTGSSDAGVRYVRDTVVRYLAAKLIEDVDIPTFDIKLSERHYLRSVDVSSIALEARNDLIRAPLQEITAYHESGIRTEELAALLQAVGMAGIAVGVNK